MSDGGISDAIIVERFNKAGRLVWRETDRDRDGRSDEWLRVDIRGDGSIGRIVSDQDNDGQPDSASVYQYDRGRLVGIDIYGSCGGLVEVRLTFEYDSRGYLTRDVTDSNADGQPSRIVSFEYNGAGQREWERTWVSLRDAIVSSKHYVWEDEQLVMVSRYRGEGDSGIIQYRDGYYYDAAGRLVEVRDELDGSRLLSSFAYDAEGNLMVRREYRLAGLHREIVHEYEDSRVIHTAVWHHGQLESEISYSYDCPD